MSTARWGNEIAVEQIGGVPFRMYTERPRRVEQLLAFADRWGSRPHIVQGDRVVTFEDMCYAVVAKIADDTVHPSNPPVHPQIQGLPRLQTPRLALPPPPGL